MNEPIPFDLTGQLPGEGIHVLEASAGTGKTFTIAALASRYLADGHRLASILMVTFSRAATAELRTRVRDRLDLTEAVLRRRLAGPDAELDRLLTGDEVLTELCSGTEESLRGRLHHISTALSDFDTATIATTHEFCGKMLQGLGMLAPVDPNRTFVEEIGDLVKEVASDLWLRKFSRFDGEPTLPWPQALAVAKEVTDNPGAPIPDGDQFLERVRFAEKVREDLAYRKKQLGVFTHDDQLTDLRDLLCRSEPAVAAAAKQRLRDAFSVVLIDEFQDTDPVQWDIVSTAFGTGSTLVLIGDPKQAIYAFRGAEVNSYLKAVAAAGGQHYTLDTNWRSDSVLVAALATLLGSTELGDPNIVVRPVRAHHRASRLSAPSELATPLRFRVVGQGARKKPGYRNRVSQDLVDDIAALLDSGATITVDGDPRPLEPRDVAVLVGSNWRAEQIREALIDAGTAAIFNGATSVFDTGQCQDWITLLRALDSPTAGNVRASALTAFHGWTFSQLAQADEEALNGLSAQTRIWAHTVAEHGIAALVEEITADGLSERVLRSIGGDRRLTDLHHIGQLLHRQQTRHQLGTTSLIEWLELRRDEGARNDERTRRLETDTNAVQIMTVHRSKGLQFPIVYLPDLWYDNPRRPGPDPLSFHDDSGQRVIDIGRPNVPGRSARAARWQAEDQGEALRRAYVAMTRAQCQLVIHWVPDKYRTRRSPLQRLLCGGGAGAPPLDCPESTTPADVPRLQDPNISVVDIADQAPPRSHQPAAVQSAEPVLRTFDRTVDSSWRRTSYSGLTAAAHHFAPGSAITDPLATSEMEQAETDEPAESAPSSDTDDSAIDTAITKVAAAPVGFVPGANSASPMADLPRGTEFGTLVHAIYEEFDPTSGDLLGELTSHSARWLQRYPMAGLRAEDLARALLPAATTPLGPIADNLRLSDFEPADRLAELDFEYPLAGGDSPTALLRLKDLADLLDEHLPVDDLLADYPERLRDPELGEEVLRGFLIGSIDAVLRVGADPTRRHLVVDYKTNWLGPAGADLRVEHYQPRAMAAAMMDSHYPLQALLYCVALHRFLRWRLPDYDPHTHLGGVLYLFVRGMAGGDTPAVDQMPCGVFSWHPGAALVQALSDLIDQGAR